jgi:hypothetical protein
VQRAAYVSEAEQYFEPMIPPLIETLAQLRSALGVNYLTALRARRAARRVATQATIRSVPPM